MKPTSSHRRTLRSFPKRVIVEWLEQRGISYFDEEIEGVEKRLKARSSGNRPETPLDSARVPEVR